jgi:hypothetical protein
VIALLIVAFPLCGLFVVPLFVHAMESTDGFHQSRLNARTDLSWPSSVEVQIQTLGFAQVDRQERCASVSPCSAAPAEVRELPCGHDALALTAAEPRRRRCLGHEQSMGPLACAGEVVS